MSLIRGAIRYLAPIFIVSAPVTSYADQIYAIHKNRSAAGFSLDIPLIMLTASITKYIFHLPYCLYPPGNIANEEWYARVFYWLGDHYDTSLLIQALVMILVQLVLLHVLLSNRALPDPSKDLNTPFAPARSERRPYDFWQWRERKPYFLFVLYWAFGLGILHFLVGRSPLYVHAIGYLALAFEATLPVPQIISNQQNRSCKGFRLSVLANWLVGDAFKMSFFFLSESNIPWAFKLCGLFQWACDIYLGVQFAQFGSSTS